MRTTKQDIWAILETTVDPGPFMHTAHLLVEAYLGGAGYSEALLAEIERWWAAHLCCTNDARVTSVTMGQTRVVYQKIKEGTGLLSTSYGQQVLMLDTKGILAGEAAGLKNASFYVD